jgi:hypothetical protein
MMLSVRQNMTHAANLLERSKGRVETPTPGLDEDTVRRLRLAASGRSGVNLADMSPEEIDRRLLGR